MGEVEMSSTATGHRLNGLRQGAVAGFQHIEALFSAMMRIDIENDNARDSACDDGKICHRPAGKPAAYVLLGGQGLLIALPADDGSLLSFACRHDGPAAYKILKCCGQAVGLPAVVW